MTKVTLDMDTFKALASDTRLDILKTLDGKKMSLKDISTVTKLNKATLHEHLTKLNEAGLVKRNEREGHKWVIYKLTWKGECLLHPENTKIVVMFATTFIALAAGIVQMIWYIKGSVVNFGHHVYTSGNDVFMGGGGSQVLLDESLKSSSWDLYTPQNIPPSLPSFLDKILANKPNIYDRSLSIPFSNNFNEECGVSDGSVISTGSPNIDAGIGSLYQEPIFLYIAVACFAIFTIVLCMSLWRYTKNKKLKI